MICDDDPLIVSNISIHIDLLTKVEQGA